MIDSTDLHRAASSVTALLPAWRAAEFIQPTLDCLSAQTYPQLSVIVSVDLCEDGTTEICEAHAARDSRFKVIRQTERLGYVGNCNALLEIAESDYALFAFHDDILAPGYVARLTEVLDKDPEVVVSFSDVDLTHTDGSKEFWEFGVLEGVTDPVQRGLTMLSEEHKWWVPNRGLFRMAQIRHIGGLKTHGAGEFSCDWPWLFHMSLLGKFARVPETLCFKYYTSQSLSRSWTYTPAQQIEVYGACLRELWNSRLNTREKLDLAVPLTNYLHQILPEAAGKA